MLNNALSYLKKYWLIHSFLAAYFILLALRSVGFDIWLPACIITETTGYSCLGCGLNTAAIHLLRFEFAQAFTANPLIYVYVLLIMGWISYDFYKFNRKH